MVIFIDKLLSHSTIL